MILTMACIDEALKSSELRLRSRSCGPPAATAGALSKKVPASEPAPSLAKQRLLGRRGGEREGGTVADLAPEAVAHRAGHRGRGGKVESCQRA